ncbi:putative phosphothreonine lyase domain-containg protein [Streptomyces sp. WAC 01529]|uniref:putative phosphothreonine lyase domain-containing protein n=1 Tax=Streptomyces sp. WAC 01529 TaxID=2203205 RepID=UPI0013DF30AA|nr:putative phosphothreonine lyase domain-containg protein [Streptomyces sp. WAC 01529]
MHDKPTQTGQQPAKALPPAADTRQRWQWAMAPGVDFSAPAAVNEFAKAGKWLWFLPVRALDAGWRLIKTAVEGGQLGPGAKVATLGSDFDGDPTRRPVIIYTANHHDKEDVQRVLNALRALGVRDALAYQDRRGHGARRIRRRNQHLHQPRRNHQSHPARPSGSPGPHAPAAGTGGRGTRPAAPAC